MISAPVSEVPTVLVVSSNQSFRAHLEKWLPTPAVIIVESQGPSNLRQRVEATPPTLVVVDQQLERYSQLLGDLAAVAPGVPYLSVSLEHIHADQADQADQAGPVEREEGWVSREYPTRESLIEAIRKVAPAVAARLD